jgi:iron uptake system component EfeO
MQAKATCIALVLGLMAAGCSSDSSDEDKGQSQQFEKELPQQMHDSLQDDLTQLIKAAKALQADAPTPSGRGWDPELDAEAIAAMKKDWRDCRIAYEHIEGALAPIFPDLDASLDARYDDFLAQLAGEGDPNPFDDEGGTGMHWVERILYSDQVRSSVVAFEETLPGYASAAFPATEDEATDFKTKLLQKLIDDATEMKDQWKPAAIDAGVAFQGLISLMNEQKEKVNKAATGEEESRYADMTPFDLRNNLEGTSKIYELFRPWILSKKSGDEDRNAPASDAAIRRGFDELSALYDSDPGDAIPEPPASWSSDEPSAADLKTPFGKLWSSVHAAVDPTDESSVVSEMNDVATILGFPQFVEDS